MADNEFLTAQVSIRVNLERLKVDLAAAKQEVYRSVDALSAKAAKGDVDKLAKRSALINQRGIKDQIKAENDLLRSLRQREVQNNKIAREHRRSINSMISDLKRFSREAFIMGAGITAAMGYTVKKYADAEKSMRVATARSDTSLTEESFDQLLDKAADVAVQFNLSVQDISKGFEVLKKSGFVSAEQMTLLPTIVTLAKGTGTELGLTATKLLDVMNVFDIGMDQLDTTINYLAYGTVNARTSLSDLMEGLLSIGNIASLTSNDFKDMSAMLLLMAQAGSEGASASRALRRILSDLTDESSKGATILGDYIDVYNHFADGTSAMKPFKQIIDELGVALSKVDATTRNTVLTKWFDENALAGGLALFKGGSALIDQFAQSLENSGAAAQTLVNNQLKALWEQLGILYQQLLTIIRPIGQALVPAIERINIVMRPYLKALREWMELNPEIVQSLATVAAVSGVALVSLGALGISIEAIVIVLKPLIPIVSLFGTAMMAAFSFWPIAIFTAVAALYAMRAAWNQNMGAIKDRMQWVVDSIKTALDWLGDTAFGQFLKWLYTTWVDTMKQIRDGWGDFLANLVGLTRANLGVVGHLFTAFGKSMREELTGHPFKAIQTMKDAYATVPEAWSRAFVAGTESAKSALGDFNEYIGDSFTTAGVYLKAYGLAVGENASEVMEAMKLQFKADLNSLIGMLTEKFPQFTNLLEKYRAEVTAGVGAGAPFKANDIQQPTVALANWKLGIKEYYQDISKLNVFVQDSFTTAAGNIENAMGDAFYGIMAESKKLKDVLLDFLTAINQEIFRMLAQLMARQLMSSVITTFLPDISGGGVPAGDLNTGMANIAHTGGTVGTTSFPQREVSAGLFNNAPRFHSGLGSNEFPAILERGERVIPKTQKQSGAIVMAAPQIIINNNTDTPIKQEKQAQFDGKNWVVNIVAENIHQGGLLATTIKGVR